MRSLIYILKRVVYCLCTRSEQCVQLKHVKSDLNVTCHDIFWIYSWRSKYSRLMIDLCFVSECIFCINWNVKIVKGHVTRRSDWNTKVHMAVNRINIDSKLEQVLHGNLRCLCKTKKIKYLTLHACLFVESSI